VRLLRRLFQDGLFLRLADRVEQQLAKVLGAILMVVMVVATAQLVIEVGSNLIDPSVIWHGDRLTSLLGDLLNLLIALEVLQNLTGYLRRGVVQIELVLITAITAVARKVIVLPPGSESKPQLLIGLGIAVVCLSAAYWLVRMSPSLVSSHARTGPARSNRDAGPLPPHDGGDGDGSAGDHPG
jgi:uncharacterized membrane protein (DUF373 family)